MVARMQAGRAVPRTACDTFVVGRPDGVEWWFLLPDESPIYLTWGDDPLTAALFLSRETAELVAAVIRQEWPLAAVYALPKALDLWSRNEDPF